MPHTIDHATQAPVEQQAPGAIQQAQAPEQVEDESAVSPEEQEGFDRVETAAMEMVYGEAHGNVVKMLKDGAQQPVEALAQTAQTLFMQIDEKSGGTIPETVIMRGAEVTLDLVIEVAEATKAFEVDENVAGSALQLLTKNIFEQFGVQPEDYASLVEPAMGMPEMEGAMAQQQQFAGMTANGQQSNR